MIILSRCSNQTTKHITVHCESEKSCGEIMKQIKKSEKQYSIDSINSDNDVLKLGETCWNNIYFYIHLFYHFNIHKNKKF